jgi:uncharacterized Fe-S cluster-containing protein
MMGETADAILARLPGKDCGQCGYPTCAAFAAHVAREPGALQRCVHLGTGSPAPEAAAEAHAPVTWHDMLGRAYDFVLEQFPEDPGPREVILPFNPGNVERLGIRRGDMLRGRPAGVGCPVTHVGRVVEEPDTFNGLVTWCVVGPLGARETAIDIGIYTPVAYEGLVRHARAEIALGRRYFFLPRTCMLQSRHAGVVAAVARRGDALRVRLEGIWIA